MDEEEWGGEWQIGIESNGLKLANDGAEEHMQCDESPRRQWTAGKMKTRRELAVRGEQQEGERMGAMERMQVAANHGEAAWGAVGESAREPHAGSVWMQAATDIHKHTQDIQNETDRREGWGALGTKRMGERGASENRRRGEPGMMCEGESDGWEKRQRSGGRERGLRRASGGEKAGETASGTEKGWEGAGGDDLAAAESKSGEGGLSSSTKGLRRSTRRRAADKRVPVMRDIMGSTIASTEQSGRHEWLTMNATVGTGDWETAKRVLVLKGELDSWCLVGVVAAILRLGAETEQQTWLKEVEETERTPQRLQKVVQLGWGRVEGGWGSAEGLQEHLEWWAHQGSELNQCIEEIELEARALVKMLTTILTTRAGCAERRAVAVLCPRECLCMNRVPEVTKARRRYLVLTTEADLTQKEILAKEAFEIGDIVTFFGESVAMAAGEGGAEMAALIAQRKKDPTQTQYQYTVAKHYDGEEEWHIIPKADVELALQDPAGSKEFKKTLGQKAYSAMGHGQLVNHSCCPKHCNTAIEMMKIEDGEKGQMLACVVATRCIRQGDTLLTSYTEKGGAEGLPFECGCCQCAGVCGHSEARLNGSRGDFERMVEQGQSEQRPRKQWEWVAGAVVKIVEEVDGKVVWSEASRTVWRPIGGQTAAQVRQHHIPARGGQFYLSQNDMEALAPGGLRAGEGLGDGSMRYAPMAARYGRIQEMAYDGVCVVETRTEQGRCKRERLPRWRLQLDDHFLQLPGDSMPIPIGMVHSKAERDEMLEQRMVVEAVRLVVTHNPRITGLQAGNTLGVCVIDHLSMAGQEWEVKLLKRPLNSCRRVFMVVNVPLHWMLVEIRPLEGKIWVGDPLKKYGRQFLERVLQRLKGWLKGVQRRWGEAETEWEVEEAEWPQQPEGSNMCGPFAVLYAVCRLRGWEPPVKLEKMALRRWVMKIVERASTSVRRKMCENCGTSFFQKEGREGRARCADDCERVGEQEKASAADPPAFRPTRKDQRVADGTEAGDGRDSVEERSDVVQEVGVADSNRAPEVAESEPRGSPGMANRSDRSWRAEAIALQNSARAQRAAMGPGGSHRVTGEKERSMTVEDQPVSSSQKDRSHHVRGLSREPLQVPCCGLLSSKKGGQGVVGAAAPEGQLTGPRKVVMPARDHGMVSPVVCVSLPRVPLHQKTMKEMFARKPTQRLPVFEGMAKSDKRNREPEDDGKASLEEKGGGMTPRSGKVAKDGSGEERTALWSGKVAKGAEGAGRQGQQTGCRRENRDERRAKITANVCELQRINVRSKQSTQAKVREDIESAQKLDAARTKVRERVDVWARRRDVGEQAQVDGVRKTWGELEKKAHAMGNCRVESHRMQHEANERVSRKVWQALQSFNPRTRSGCARCGGAHRLGTCRALRSEEEQQGLPKAKWPRQLDLMQAEAGVPEYRHDGALPEEVRQLVADGQEFVRELVRWERETWRKRRGARLWQAISGMESVELRLGHVALPMGCDGREVIKRLQGAGIADADEWESMVMETTRCRGGVGVSTNRATVNVRVNDALRALLTGETSVQKTGESAPMIDVRHKEDGDRRARRQSHLQALSSRERQKLASWPKVLKLLGAEEAQVIALTEMEIELEAWQSSEVPDERQAAAKLPKRVLAVQALQGRQPQCLEAVWGKASSNGMTGEICIAAQADRPEAEDEELYKKCSVAGEDGFFQRGADLAHPRRTGGVRSVEYANKMYIKKQDVWLGAPSVTKIQVWQGKLEETELSKDGKWLEETRVMAAMVPEGLRRVGAKASWKLKPMVSAQEQQSAMLIRFEQTTRPMRHRDMTAASLRKEVWQMARAVQRGLCPEAMELGIEEVEVNGFWNADAMLQGTIVIAKGPPGSLEDRCRIGLTLAFMIANRKTDDTAGAFKWCPVASNPGESVCVVTSATRAAGGMRDERMQVNVKSLTADDSPLAAELVERLAGKTAPRSEWQVRRGLGRWRNKAGTPVARLEDGRAEAPTQDSRVRRRPVRLVVFDIPLRASVADVWDTIADEEGHVMGIRMWPGDESKGGRVPGSEGKACTICFSRPVDCDKVREKGERGCFSVLGCKVRMLREGGKEGPDQMANERQGWIYRRREESDMEHEMPCIHVGEHAKACPRGDWDEWKRVYGDEDASKRAWERRHLVWRDAEEDEADEFFEEVQVEGVWVFRKVVAGLTEVAPDQIVKCTACGLVRSIDGLGGVAEQGLARLEVSAKRASSRSAREDRDAACHWYQVPGRSEEEGLARGAGAQGGAPASGLGLATAVRLAGTGLLRMARERAQQLGKTGKRMDFWRRHKYAHAAQMAWVEPGAWVRQGTFKQSQGWASDWEGHAAFEVATFHRQQVTGLKWKEVDAQQKLTGRDMMNPELAEAIDKQGVLTSEERWRLEARVIFAGDFVKYESRTYEPDEEQGQEEVWTQRLKGKGFTMVACEAENILQALENDASPEDTWWLTDNGQDRKMLDCRKAACVEMLMGSGGWRRKQCTGNVISWNLGPCGLEQAKAKLKETLKLGAAAVMVQELRFPRVAKHRIRKELRKLDLNYAVHIETGPVQVGNGSKKADAWNAGQHSAVATFLHREAFNVTKTRRRAWYQGAQREGLQHMVQGRAQWLDTVTTDGKSVFVVNLHQATSGCKMAQTWTWACLKQMVLERNMERGIMAGDFNAGAARALAWTATQQQPEGEELLNVEVRSLLEKQRVLSRSEWDHLKQPSISKQMYVRTESQGYLQPSEVERARFGYADSARGRNGEADAKLGQFVHDTGGKLVSPAAPSRAGQRDLTEAKLDHLISWNLDVQDEEGLTEWVGTSCQDHARVSFRIGTETLGPARPAATRAKQHRPTTRIQDAQAIKPAVDAKCRGLDAELLQRVRNGECDAAKAKDECLQRRWQVSLQEESGASSRHCKTRMGSKLPNRNKEQVQIRRQMMVVAAALRQDRTGKEERQHKITVADQECLRMAGLAHLEQQLTAAELVDLTRCEQWAEGVTGLHKMLDTQLQSIMKKQAEIQRKRLDAECRRAMREKPGSWGEFTGKTAAKLLQKELSVSVVRGFLGCMRMTDVGVRSWQDWQTSIKAKVPGVTIQAHGQGAVMLRVTREEGQEEALDRSVQDLEQKLQSRRIDGMPIGVFMCKWARRYQAEGHEIWVVEHPEAESILEDWKSLLEQTSAGRGRTLVIEELVKPRPEEMIVSVLAMKHVDAPRVLEESKLWEEHLAWKMPVLEKGPWKEDEMTTAWEIHFEKDGYSPYARCATSSCTAKRPLVAVRVPESGCIRGNLRCQVLPVCEPTQSLQQRRELCAFCTQCWRFTDFRSNKGMVGETDFMETLGVFGERRAKPEDGGLRGDLTKGEWEAYIRTKLRNGKSPGPDKYQNELIKSMTEEGLEILRIWANEVLRGERRMTESELNGTITLLHKGGDTMHLPSDYRPVVLLNSTNQLIAHVINSRLRNIVERAGILEAGQGGYRQGRSTDVNMRKIESITKEAQRSKKRFLRTDIDFRNAYNALSQPALWAILRKYGVPDVDFLETLYEHTTVRLAPNDVQSATVTFDTGVCQGSVLSPMLFILFINALARALSAKGKKCGVAHGMRGIDQFNNLVFCDDMSLFAQNEKGMQQLLEIVEQFEQWSGIRVNLKKTMVMAVDGDKSRRKRQVEVRYRGSLVRQLQEDETCRYLGFWATPNGDFKQTKKLVFQRTKEAMEMIQHHPYTPELATQMFISKGVGSFRYSAAVVPWTESELMKLQDKWIQGFRVAWHLKEFTAKAPFVLPAECGGLELITPKVILAQTLTSHIQRCLLHKDVVQKAMLRELEEAKAFSLCTSFQDIREEMELWTWQEAQGNVWLRTAKCLRELQMELDLPPGIEEEETGGLGWAKATRALRTAYRRARSIGGEMPARRRKGSGARWCKDFWQGTDGKTDQWSMEVGEWQALEEGSKALWRAGRKLWRAGKCTVATVEQQQLRKGPRIPAGLRATQETDGEQRVRIVIPRGMAGIPEQERLQLQKLLDLVDWKGLGAMVGMKSNQRGVDLRVEKCERCDGVKYKGGLCASKVCRQMTPRAAQILEWLAQVAKGGDVADQEGVCGSPEQVAAKLHEIEKAADEEKMDGLGQSICLHPERVLKGIRRWMQGGATPSSGVCGDQERAKRCRGVLARVLPRMMEKLHPDRNRVWGRCLKTSLKLVQWQDRCEEGQDGQVETEGTAEAGEEGWYLGVLGNIDMMCSRCDRCQTKKAGSCAGCGMTRCMWCTEVNQACEGCGSKMASRSESDGLKQQPKRKAGHRYGRNVHSMGETLIEEVKSVRRRVVPNSDSEPVDERLEFEARIRGWEMFQRQQRMSALLDLGDEQLVAAIESNRKDLVMFIPQAMFPARKDEVEFGDKGWWYVPSHACQTAACTGCRLVRNLDQFEIANGRRKARCEQCVLKPASKRRIGRTEAAKKGLVCETADPRYAGREADRSGGDIILDVGAVRKILGGMKTLTEDDMTVWLTTREMGFALAAEQDELAEAKDDLEGKPTGRWIAPQIEKFLRKLKAGEERMNVDDEQEEARMYAEALTMLDDWGNPNGERVARRESDESTKIGEWESASEPMVAKEPKVIRDVDINLEIGQSWFFNHEIPKPKSGEGYVRTVSEPFRWTEECAGIQVLNTEGRATSTDPKQEWVITSMQWNFLKAKNRQEHNGVMQGRALVERLHTESMAQEKLERQGNRCLTWRMLRSLQAVFEATTLHGGTMVTAAPFFDTAKRGKIVFWGDGKGPEVVLWDTLDEEDRRSWKEAHRECKDYIVVRRKPLRVKEKGKTKQQICPPGRCVLELSRGEQKGKPDCKESEGKEQRGRGQRAAGWWKRGDVQATLNEYGIECWMHAELTDPEIGEDQLRMIKASWECIAAKDECQIKLNEREAQYWLGTEPGQLGVLGFRGVVAAADGSDSDGRMGAGFCTLNWRMPGDQWRMADADEKLKGREIFLDEMARDITEGYSPSERLKERLELMGVAYGDYIRVQDKVFTPVDDRVRGWARVGREEEGTSSYRAELAALLMLLRKVQIESDVAVLLDCKSEITEIGKWLGEGSRATMAGVANEDLLRPIIEMLRQRVETGAVTVLLKVKAHRGEPLNEEADDCADLGRLVEAEHKEWTDRSERIIFRWQAAGGVQRRSAWGAGVRIAMRKQGAWLEYRRHMAEGGRRWSEDNWLGPDMCGRQPREEAVQMVRKGWFDLSLEEWNVKCTDDGRQEQSRKKQKKQQQSPATDSWTVDFMTRQGESRECIHKWLKCRSISWKKRRRLLQVLTGTFPCGHWLNKIGRGQGKGCELCARKREAGSRPGRLEVESMGHIQSAYCKGQAEVVTAAHNRCNRLIQREIQRLVEEVEVITVEHESSMQTIWEHEMIKDICSWKELAEAAWAAHEGEQPRQRESKKRSREGGTGGRTPQGVENADEKDEDEAAGRLKRMSGASDKCAEQCWRSDDDEEEERVCCQCKGKEEKGTDALECKRCWQQTLGDRRFDGVAVNRTKKVIYTFEFKRTSDREHGYVQRCDERATEQYAGLVQIITKIVMCKGWKVQAVNFIAGTKSMNQEAWNKAMEVMGVPKQKWDGTRERFMKVLLDEHETILSSYLAQKYGGGEESTGKVTQG